MEKALEAKNLTDGLDIELLSLSNGSIVVVSQLVYDLEENPFANYSEYEIKEALVEGVKYTTLAVNRSTIEVTFDCKLCIFFQCLFMFTSKNLLKFNINRLILHSMYT